MEKWSWIFIHMSYRTYSEFKTVSLCLWSAGEAAQQNSINRKWWHVFLLFFQASDPIPAKKSKHEEVSSQPLLNDADQQQDWLQSLSTPKVGTAATKQDTGFTVEHYSSTCKLQSWAADSTMTGEEAAVQVDGMAPLHTGPYPWRSPVPLRHRLVTFKPLKSLTHWRWFQARWCIQGHHCCLDNSKVSEGSSFCRR